jgi:hypothetical protein
MSGSQKGDAFADSIRPLGVARLRIFSAPAIVKKNHSKCSEGEVGAGADSDDN